MLVRPSPLLKADFHPSTVLIDELNSGAFSAFSGMSLSSPFANGKLDH